MFFLILIRLLWQDVVSVHEVQELPRDLLKGLLGQQCGIMLEFRERHKLHDVTFHVLAESFGVQWLVVCIKHVHGGKVCITNTDDNDRNWEGGSTHYLVNCLLHVHDLAISDDQKDQVLLVSLGYFQALGHVIHRLDDLIEVSRTIQLNIVQGMCVSVKDTFQALALRVKDVAIESEAMRNIIRI